MLQSLRLPLQWRHNKRDGVSNHQPHHCLLNRLFKRRSKKTSKLRVTGPCEENSPVTGEFPSQRVSNAENVSIWWRHRVNAWKAVTSTASLTYPVTVWLFGQSCFWWTAARILLRTANCKSTRAKVFTINNSRGIHKKEEFTKKCQNVFIYFVFKGWN